MGTLNDVDGSVAALESALNDAPILPAPGGVPAMVTRHGQEEEHLQLEHGASLSQWLHSLAAQELARRLAGCTV